MVKEIPGRAWRWEPASKKSAMTCLASGYCTRHTQRLGSPGSISHRPCSLVARDPLYWLEPCSIGKCSYLWPRCSVSSCAKLSHKPSHAYRLPSVIVMFLEESPCIAHRSIPVLDVSDRPVNLLKAIKSSVLSILHLA